MDQKTAESQSSLIQLHASKSSIKTDPSLSSVGCDLLEPHDPIKVSGDSVLRDSKTIREKISFQMPSLVSMGSTKSLVPTIESEDRIKIMGKFLSGFKRFHKTYFADNGALFDTLKDTQSPKTLVVGCCDSRVDPAIITDCDPGDLFVVRNVANLVAPYQPDYGYHGVSAALEYAVKKLQVEFIIVLGHTRCGGIEALMEGGIDGTEFVGTWMKIASRAKERALKYFGDQEPHLQRRACEHASILNSLENLLTYPWIRERLQQGKLNISGWYFDFDAGDLLSYNPETNVFEALVNPSSPSKWNHDMEEQAKKTMLGISE